MNLFSHDAVNRWHICRDLLGDSVSDLIHRRLQLLHVRLVVWLLRMRRRALILGMQPRHLLIRQVDLMLHIRVQGRAHFMRFPGLLADLLELEVRLRPQVLIHIADFQ